MKMIILNNLFEGKSCYHRVYILISSAAHLDSRIDESHTKLFNRVPKDEFQTEDRERSFCSAAAPAACVTFCSFLFKHETSLWSKDSFESRVEMSKTQLDYLASSPSSSLHWSRRLSPTGLVPRVESSSTSSSRLEVTTGHDLKLS